MNDFQGLEEQPKTCDSCGAKMVDYRHKLNVGIVISLKKLYDVGGSAHLNALQLSYISRSNFQKLRYWGLVGRREQESGVWIISSYGRAFIEGKVTAPSHVWSYRGQPIDKDDKDITYVNFSDFVGNATTQKEKDLLTYKKRPDYADDAEPHG